MPLPDSKTRRAEAYATLRAMAESGQPTSAEVVCPIIAPSRNVCWLQQHVVRVSQPWPPQTGSGCARQQHRSAAELADHGSLQQG